MSQSIVLISEIGGIWTVVGVEALPALRVEGRGGGLLVRLLVLLMEGRRRVATTVRAGTDASVAHHRRRLGHVEHAGISGLRGC